MMSTVTKISVFLCVVIGIAAALQFDMRRLQSGNIKPIVEDAEPPGAVADRGFRILLCTLSQYSSPTTQHVARFKRLAERTGMFDRISVYTVPDVSRTIDYAHMKIPQKSIYGIKLLKPMTILTAMKSADENDVIVYADINSGFHSNADAATRFSDYIENLFKSTSKRIAFSMNQFPEYKYTSAELLEIFDFRDPKTLELPQLSSDLLFFINTKENQDLVQAWFDILQANNYRFLVNNHDEPGLVKHNSETSVLSCLLKNEGVYIEEEPNPYDMKSPIIIRGF